ncbi:pectate lyase-like adhesive domain-containing protein [Candidatus Enterococcus ferrettii]|uniref:pectate lyase-like adhesive domain-containing protein n=1 Tax=Candidatus Enterococcus ferrettii TaxID=2815324 RepID=UPI003221747D
MKRKITFLATLFLFMNAAQLPAWAEETSTIDTSSTEQTSQTTSTEQESTTELSSTEHEAASSSTSTEESITHEDSTDNSTESSSEAEQEVQEAPTARATVLAAAGDGTEANPYQITNFQELKDALATSVASGQTQYIQLQNDIVYNTTDISIKQNTVIDGNGHALLYDGTAYKTTHFGTGANNISVTYKNLTFGNSTYPNSTWYGILRTENTGIKFTVENIKYNIQNGSQAFWGNNGSENILTLKGKNEFYSSGNTDGGEFVEGYPDVTFAEGSDTTIYNDSTDATAIFYSTSQSVTVEKNASLAIESSKTYLFYGGAALNVQEQGNFSYKNIYGVNSTSNTATLSTGTLTANFAKDSIGHFTTDVNGFSGSNPIINLNSPDYVVFDSTSSSRQVLGSMNPIFRRADSDTPSYKIAYLTTSGQKDYVPKVATGSSYTVTSSNIGSGYSVAYAKMPTIEDVSATPTTGQYISTINAQINSVTPATAVSSKVQYKLATKQLYSGDITADAAQTSIEQAGTAEGVVQTADIVLPENTTPAGADSKHAFAQLPAQKYYLYTKAKSNDQRITGYTFDTLWKETSAEVPPYVQILFSTDAMAFDSPIPGQFGKQKNLDSYTVRNAGNVPTETRLTKITRNSDSSEKLSLVDQFDTRDQELILSLIAEKADSGEKITLGPLSEQDPLSLNAVALNPFWDTDAQADLYLAGDYSGPMIGPQKFSYRFSFAISEITTN